ncbi:hypothetical protein VTN00DRAFT_4044 [Thermoascus crustaceus]|uniref:uncharacterized protein n=1 Tax=Thermoascus crustaceus TaxID=5088 RepID=UPI0037440BE7
MDITGQSFFYHLPRILDGLATCCFVALDLELSGIATNPAGPSTGAQTLQERYNDIREAADRYQVLQIGLTIGLEDPKTGTYTLKPYNLHLSPIIDQKLEVERNWSFQSSAVEFLMGNKFRIEAPFQEGVPYLSRDEEKLAMAKAVERRDRVTVPSDIDVKETDHESLQFLKVVRSGINAWLALGDSAEKYLNIPPPKSIHTPKGKSAFPTALNRFQKRLVHQLVQSEYPSLVTIGKPTFVQIIPYDEARENEIKKDRIRRTEERILRQTGFRWIAEALAGGDLSKLDPGVFTSIMSSSAAVEGKHSMKEFADRLKLRLKANRPILVGHNLFTDVVNFCRCFFGPLPVRVEDFQEMLHGLFPVLVDTKYMATHDCGSINPTSSLAEINDSLAEQKNPKIVVDSQHSKYQGKQLFHEAGYDSLLTAQVFVKLSVQLRDGGTSMQSETRPALKQRPTSVHGDTASEGAVSRASSSSGRRSDEAGSHPTQQPVNWKEKTEVSRARSAFSHRTKFDLVTDTAEETAEDSEEEEQPEDESQLLSFEDDAEIARKVKAGELIPRSGAAFWKVYGNKLRVFGTQERVLTLGKDKKPWPER